MKIFTLCKFSVHSFQKLQKLACGLFSPLKTYLAFIIIIVKPFITLTMMMSKLDGGKRKKSRAIIGDP